MKTHQAIICSYSRDFIWLPHCLRSFRKFATDYLPPVVCVEPADAADAQRIIERYDPQAKLVVTEGRKNQGFMRAQIAMMSADLHCTGDILHFVGSDCLAYERFSARIYADENELPAVLYSSYLSMNLVHPDVIPWRAGVRRVLGVDPQNEYMRRIPSVFPREIFAPMRAHVEKLHGMPFADYIYHADMIQSGQAVPRDTSEANILGAFAHFFMPETCRWVDIATAGLYGTQVIGWPTSILQMWSHGGLDRPMEACVEIPNYGNTVGKTPRQVIAEVLYDGDVGAVGTK